MLDPSLGSGEISINRGPYAVPTSKLVLNPPSLLHQCQPTPPPPRNRRSTHKSNHPAEAKKGHDGRTDAIMSRCLALAQSTMASGCELKINHGPALPQTICPPSLSPILADRYFLATDSKIHNPLSSCNPNTSNHHAVPPGRHHLQPRPAGLGSPQQAPSHRLRGVFRRAHLPGARVERGVPRPAAEACRRRLQRRVQLRLRGHHLRRDQREWLRRRCGGGSLFWGGADQGVHPAVPGL